jgi:hypothetical protein
VEPERLSSTTVKWLWRLAIFAALVAAWFLSDYVRLHAENHPAAVIELTALAGGAALLAYRWQDRRADRESSRRYRAWLREEVASPGETAKPDRRSVAPVAILLVACVWGSSTATTPATTTYAGTASTAPSHRPNWTVV